ncbi:MAG: hypothetical protein VKJ24_19595 [Synechococcales bacterium]|nr:hypothetical protein [Synechococcales bacterium]
MQDKQKVTLYLPSDLHRQLKIRAAVAAEPMSSLAEKALCFYLTNPEVVENIEAHGQTHRLYSCPECSAPLALREGEIVKLGQQPSILAEDLLADAIEVLNSEVLNSEQPILNSGQPEGQLVPC